jgi:hypothetical protein
LYSLVEARANAIIEQEEDLTTHTRDVNEWALLVEALEERPLEREGLDDLKLSTELEGLATRKSALEAERQAPED